MGNADYTFAVETEALSRAYKTKQKKGEAKVLQALKGVDLQIRKGELFGVLGPNGAGKSTLIKILMTLLAPSSGKALVCGRDVVKDVKSLRPRINMVSGGETSGYGLLTIRENLWMFGQFYGLDSAEVNRRIDVLLEHFKLSDRKNTRSGDLSTGLRQKMNIIRGFLTDPEVLFLDEPTLGLDVSASRDIRGFIRGWMAESSDRTLLLTTHYLQEADELCDRIAIVNHGRVLACDTPAALKRRVAEYPRFDIKLGVAGQVASHIGAAGAPVSAALGASDVSDLLLTGLTASLSGFPGLRSCTPLAPRGDTGAAGNGSVDAAANGTHTAGNLSVRVEFDEESALTPFLGELAKKGYRVVSLQNREPSLEDVFVALTGTSIEEAERAPQE